MLTITHFTEILDKLADELPESFYEKLNLGIVISPTFKIHPKSKNNDLLILGEYTTDRYMGRGIIIYYTSFLRVHPDMSEEDTIIELRRILRHEFTHHLESLAGENWRTIKDNEEIATYLGKNVKVDINNNPEIPEEDNNTIAKIATKQN